MYKWKHVLFNITLAINCLLLFLIVFENRLEIPSWLQVAGRMHPMLVHFPLVLVLVYAAIALFTSGSVRQEASFARIMQMLLVWAALMAGITALMGTFLSKEPGYDAESIALHKWTGIITSWLLCLIAAIPERLVHLPLVRFSSIAMITLLVIFTGHLGGNITHGENFVLAPMTPPRQVRHVAFEDAMVYNDLVYPILENKCTSCHNPDKMKGQLNMESYQTLLKGGEHGALWDTTKEESGLLLTRIYLPDDDKKHMPPSGKAQLTDLEKEILFAWIKSGAIENKQVITLDPEDTLRKIAAKQLKSGSNEVYDFEPANEKQILQLNTNNRVITPLFENSPALVVNFFNAQFYSLEKLKDLSPISKQIVELNLVNMPVKDEDLTTIGNFTSLRRLNLSSTAITGKTINALKRIPKLRSLALSDNQLVPHSLDSVPEFPSLKSLYIWNTNFDSARIDKLENENKNIAFYTGFTGDTVVMKLTPPVVDNAGLVLSEPTKLLLKNYVNGTAIRYTLDGTDPDSVNSPIFDGNVFIDKTAMVKAKSYKPGWITSDVATFQFFKGTKKPDSIDLVTNPDPTYPGSGKTSLTDDLKSELNVADGKWLGYHGAPMIVQFYFDTPLDSPTITLSALLDVGRYIFPPKQIEVWTQSKSGKLTLAKTVIPKQPTKNPNEQKNLALPISLKEMDVAKIKLVVRPVMHLPSWHPGKGDKGWVFIDEIFFD